VRKTCDIGTETDDELKIVPRKPGLDSVKRDGEEYTAAELVDVAESELLEWLKDPYHYEAYQRLQKDGRQREKHPALKKRSGIQPAKGRLASRLQNPQAPQMRKKRGRKPIDRPFLRRLIVYAKERGITMAELSRKILRKEYPAASERVIKTKAKGFAQMLRTYKQKLKG